MFLRELDVFFVFSLLLGRRDHERLLLIWCDYEYLACMIAFDGVIRTCSMLCYGLLLIWVKRVDRDDDNDSSL